MNRELARLAARQFGVFSNRQAMAAGLAYSTIRGHAAAGGLVGLHPGTYAVAGSAPTWERGLMAAVLASGPGAAASHRSAGRLWRLTDESDDTVEVSVPRARGPRLSGVVLHRSGDLVESHVSRGFPMPVTKPARTIVDLGAVLPPWKVEDALDRALILKRTSVAGVEWIRNEVSERGRSGAGVIGRILDERALGTDPPDGLLEPRMARLLRQANLPLATYQFVLRTPEGVFLAEVDFAYPDILLAIEVDGYAVHGTPRAMAKDFVRQNGLVPHGWHVLRFTWNQVVYQPEVVAAQVRAALTAFGG